MFVTGITNRTSPGTSFNHIKQLAFCRTRLCNSSLQPIVSKYHFSNVATVYKNESTETSPDQPESLFDSVFSSLEIRKKANDLWKLDSQSYANIIYPNGRAEISEKSKKIKQDRVVNGFRRLSSTGSKSLLEQRGQQILDRNLTAGYQQSSRETDEEVPLWKKHKLAMKKKLLGKAWNPQRKLTSKAMDEVRYLHKQFPDTWTTPKLAEHYNVASESIAKILKSNFQLSPERIAEQDNKKAYRKKLHVEADIEKLKSERQAIWMQKKAERISSNKSRISATTPIKLGAPKRSIS